MVAMLAPSFPIVFSYPEIIGKLKRLGFQFVVEVSLGADETNKHLLNLLKQNPKARFITSPCASFKGIIKTRYPNLVKYLTPIDSPMIYIARIVKEKWKDCQPVFIGPCFAKKLEAKDYPELDILVLTFKELEEVFKELNLNDQDDDKNHSFDLEFLGTRLYSVSGGLSQSSNLQIDLTEAELQVVSGPKNCELALENFEKNHLVRLLDILYCEGGCISGSGIESSLGLAERREKIISFWRES